MKVQHKEVLVYGAEVHWGLAAGADPAVEIVRLGTMRAAGDEDPFEFEFVHAHEQAANPEALLAAAQAACYATAFGSVLAARGLDPRRLVLRTACLLEREPPEGPGQGWRVGEVRVEVLTELAADAPDELLDAAADEADRVCPISKAIAAPVRMQVRPFTPAATG